MKKLYLLLSACALLVGTTIAQNRAVSVKKTATPITIDGEEDAAWAIADTMNIWYWGKGKSAPNELDFKAYFRLLWDDNYLYFIGYIDDDDLMTQERAAELQLADWEVDCWEIYWSPGNSTKADMTEMTQVRLAYANKSSADPTATTKGGWSEGGFMNGTEFITAAMYDLGSGYIIEAAIDLAVSAEAAALDKIGDNSVVGFNVIANDIDGTSTSRENIGGPIEGAQWNQADTLMRLTLLPGSAIKNTSNTAWKVYPNPVVNELRFTSNIALESIEVFNTEGKLVLKASKPNGSVNVSLLPAGLYAVKATAENGKTFTQKIIKK
ncbi:MAG: T9SS type A sorting domain-containing protein [Bacteroidales bacterium]|nr:T9SS type A sorting domain-containing protein [Bacteroidales bacterium]